MQIRQEDRHLQAAVGLGAGYLVLTVGLSLLARETEAMPLEDSDGDGLSDRLERMTGTDPFDRDTDPGESDPSRSSSIWCAGWVQSAANSRSTRSR